MPLKKKIGSTKMLKNRHVTVLFHSFSLISFSIRFTIEELIRYHPVYYCPLDLIVLEM